MATRMRARVSLRGGACIEKQGAATCEPGGRLAVYGCPDRFDAAASVKARAVPAAAAANASVTGHVMPSDATMVRER